MATTTAGTSSRWLSPSRGTRAVEDSRYGGFSLASPELRDALTQMGQWLTTLANERPGTPSHRRVVAAKPVGLADACWTRDAAHTKIVQPHTANSTGDGGQLFPVNPTLRMVAGAPITDDIIACHRNAIDWSDYHVNFTPAEQTELGSMFRSGVFDWTKPGVGQQPLSGTLLTFD